MKIERIVSGEVFAPPASYAQERLWFLEQLEPGTAIYNIPYMVTVKGSVHRTAFNRAVNRLIARHESLRTCFIESTGSPRQVVYADLSVQVDWEDLGGLDAHTASGRLQAICTEVTSTPFDLKSAPLFRIIVVATGRETTVISTMHHIISDGWSIGIFQRDLMALYHEELGGRPASLPALRIQYADFAVWQRRKLEGEGLDRLRRYWVRQLEGATTILEVPGDYERPLKQTFAGDVLRFDIAPELASAIKALTRTHDVTLFMTLFTAFATLLYRLTGHDDVLVGTPIAGRKGADVENLVGFFVNTLVLRARMQHDRTFVELLSDVKTMTLEAFEHQDMPFEKLVLELNPKRDLAHSPLIQVLFSLQNIPSLQQLMSDGAEGSAGSSQNLEAHTGTAKFELALFVSEVGDGLQCAVEFNTDVFTARTIGNLRDHLLALLHGIAEHPDAEISSYPLLSPPERQRCLDVARGPDAAYSAGLGCHHLFEAQCERSPLAAAVADAPDAAGASMTYAELNAYSNRLARYLVSQGVQPGDKVCICMSRSVHQIAAVLAVVKAGGAYVPLDPEYPQERLRLIVDDIGFPLLVTSSEIADVMADTARSLVLEEHADEVGELPAGNLDSPFSPELPLYVIYTSGSTGRPKGVVMPHRAIVNLVEWQAASMGVQEGAVTLQYAPLNFDVASQEIFSTLTSGGCLQVVDERSRRDSGRLLDMLEERHVWRVYLPPAALEQLADVAGGRRALGHLRDVIVAGDKLRVTDSVRTFFEAQPGARLINQYGPTESHVVSSHTLEGAAAQWPVHPPIGKPIANVQLYVLDDDLDPVPPKVTGELYIGGVAVALGYLNMEQSTQERFTRDPFSSYGVLYRTGDLCRSDGHGELTFVGRADQQIKLRGFRIEPGEVEVTLKRDERVTDAVVVKQQSRNGDDQLVAYVIRQDGAAYDRAAMRASLIDRLPSYMVPAQLVCVDEFPMTNSGKIDRLRLPEPPESEAVRPTETYVAPRTEVERFLAGVWCTLLQIDRVSIHDNFFELGGHSLTATQLVSRIRDQFGVEVPIYSVFERPTLDLLALEVLQRQASHEADSEVGALLSELECLSEEELDALLAEDA